MGSGATKGAELALVAGGTTGTTGAGSAVGCTTGGFVGAVGVASAAEEAGASSLKATPTPMPSTTTAAATAAMMALVPREAEGGGVCVVGAPVAICKVLAEDAPG